MKTLRVVPASVLQFALHACFLALVVPLHYVNDAFMRQVRPPQTREG